MRILGVSCDYHDAAAALVVDGEVVAAAEEERFSRTKHDRALPERAIRSCLAIGELGADQLDAIVFHEKPLVVASRVIAARQRRGPRAIGSFAREFPVLVGTNLMIEARLSRLAARLGSGEVPRIVYGEHHLSHAAAAFYPSPFETAAILTIDAIGEWSTATLGQGLHHRIDLLAEQRYPHSLGLLYSLITEWCGFRPNDGEYKLMGLAPLGDPGGADALRDLVAVDADGGLQIADRTVRWWSGDRVSRRRLTAILGGPPRRPDDPLEQHHRDLARAMQDLTEEVVLAMAAKARRDTGERALCLGGGVALNGTAMGRLAREGPFEQVWVQPAAGDAGSALGAALWWWHQEVGSPRPAPESDRMAGCALGPSFASDEVGAWLRAIGCRARRIADDDRRADEVAARLADGQVVGWFEGPMEFGPRALGRRSILADPRQEAVRDDLNRRVKGRESFRPFAPAVLAEEAAEWFELDGPSPHMSLVVPVRRHDIPACTHVDGTARVQTVDADRQPAFHRLLRAFAERTGCPVLLNTSFNHAGEPIACTPEDALASARRCQLDLLVLEDHLIEGPDLREARPS